MNKAQESVIRVSTGLIETELGQESPDFNKREIVSAIKSLNTNLTNLGVLDGASFEDGYESHPASIRLIAEAGRKYLKDLMS